ncbi:MAG: alpha/beta hydrolase [Candidatus Accumulibacter sp.]|uniref:alpha/beta hydrolase n=1 Tax=Accumulibacter sp. TaxID=2053492 RepID=UPI0019DA0168|nr:alpha/beta hydrolase [Accumulibacter sp.]MBE2258139.1 alpha/beta hydrolase [Paracoccaceae bacterium]MCB1941685.1 alpha/beta hydrolase [Accumulibacter sp.]MCP5247832.1 alpha/beta hydrolase [Accumulibacter sp.]
MRPRRLHAIHCAPSTTSGGSPLLFLHGGYVDARSWDAHFLPYFAAHGHDCFALDFSGHGRSEGRLNLDALSLDDYLADARQLIADLGRQPVVIGHSMGSFIAERILEESLAEAAVLISPVPTMGTFESAARLLLSHPQFLCEVANVTSGRVSRNALRLIKEIYFSPATTPETLRRFTELLQPESTRAICDLTLLGWRWPPRRPSLPVLVIGGELDTVFPPRMIWPVARRWHAELQIVADTGHALILDEHWQSCADAVLGWLARRGTPTAATAVAVDGSPCLA